MGLCLIKSILFLGLCAGTATAYAGPVEDLLALDHRPTVTEIKNAFGGSLPNENPFGTPTKSLQELVLSNGPKVIAMFEKAYPGATYAPLGRDSVFLGDILDAFYQSLGQSRVRRVSASGNSLEGHSHLAVRFLKTSGFDLADLDTAFPFIMFDQTNWRSDSQSVTYVRAVAEECARLKCDAKKLFEKFNFINTGASHNMYPHHVMTPAFDLNTFFKTTLRTIQSRGLIFDILSIPVEHDLVYTAPYHDTFDKFTVQADGSVIARPGPMQSAAVRMQILAEVFEMIRGASSLRFHVAVEFAAHVLGYEFPHSRVRDPIAVAKIRGIAPKPITQDSPNAEIADLSQPKLISFMQRTANSSFKALPDRSEEGVPSENWATLKFLMSESIDLAPTYLADSIGFLFKIIEGLHHEGKLSRADVREFILYIMTNMFGNTDTARPQLFLPTFPPTFLPSAIQESGFIRAELDRHLIWLSGADFKAARAALGPLYIDTEAAYGRRYFESLIPDPDRQHGRRNLFALIKLGRGLSDNTRLDLVNSVLGGVGQGHMSELEKSIFVFDAIETRMRHTHRVAKSQQNPLEFLFEFNSRLGPMLKTALLNLPQVYFPNPAPLSQALVVLLERKDLPVSVLPSEIKRAAHEIAKPGPDSFDRLSNHLVNALLFEALFNSAIARCSKGEAGLNERRELAIAYLEASLTLLKGEKIAKENLRDALESVLRTGISTDKAFQKRFNSLYTYHAPIRDATNSMTGTYSTNALDADARRLIDKAPNKCSRALRKVIGF
jgi:hypothetical protein